MHSRKPEKQKAPFGSWPSPVTAGMVAGKSLRLGQPRIDAGAVYWTESRPHEGGRNVLVKWTAQAGCTDLTPEPYSVQSKVHEYGGGAFTAHGNDAWFVNRQDQCVYHVRNGNIRRLAESSQRHFADLVHDPLHHRLLAVCEDHDDPHAEPVTRLVDISCGDGTVRVLREGCDFYSSPRPSPHGNRLAWLEWNHPDMPWDSTRLFVAELDETGMPQPPRCIAGGEEESVVQPVWRNNDELVFASDRGNWWNLHAWNEGETRVLKRMNAEFALPHWVFGMQSYGFRDADSLVCAYTSNGTWRLAEVGLADDSWKDIVLPYTQIEHVHAADGGVVLQAASARQAMTVVLLDDKNRPRELRHAATVDVHPDFLAAPAAVAFETGDGDQAYGLYYAPANSDFTGEPGTAPPLLVKVHGGPTAATSSALDMKIRFWTSRGFAVLDVNYRGSTGYGRDYRKKLYGQWGVTDVADCINGARELAGRGLADPERLLISGSSAGGFTVLAALTFHDVFAAGASYYGIGDLAGAMQDTAKFESRYGDKLIGPLPETANTWQERSPLFHAEKLQRPVIFFQGLEDRVVPPDQSERMFGAARANGVATAYLPFPGEGHGFRQAQTIEAALNAEYRFYCEVLGLDAGNGALSPESVREDVAD